MTSEGEVIGQLTNGRLDPVAEGTDGASYRSRQALALGARMGEDDLGPTSGVGGRPGVTDEAAIQQQAGRGRASEQGIGDRTLVDSGGHDPPASDEAAAQVGLNGQAK